MHRERNFLLKVKASDKEIRRRIKVIDSLPSEESVRKITYLKVIEKNNRYRGRTMLGFNIFKDDIMGIYGMRYP